MREVLTRGFIAVWCAGFLLQGAYWIATTVLQWQVAILPGSTPKDLGALYFGQLLPMMLMTPIAGAMVDRFNRKLIIASSLVGIAAIGATGALLDGAGSLTFAACLALGAAIGLILAFQSPAFHVFIPAMVPKTGLSRAVSLYAVAQNGNRMIGPMIAGALLVVGGVSLAFWWVVAIAVAGVIATSFIPQLPVVRPAVKEGLLAQFGGGFAVLGRQPAIRRAIVLVALNCALGLSYASMLSVVATEMGVGERGFSMLMGAAGLGALLGALLPYPRVRRLVDVSWLFLIAVVGLVGLAFSASLVPATICSFVISGAGIAVTTKLNVVVQRQLTDDVRGRVMSLYSWAWGGSLPLGGLLLGYIGEATSVSTGFLVLAGLLGATAIFNAVTARSLD